MEDDIYLSWEKNHPERAAWTDHVIAELILRMPLLTRASDITEFARNYPSLNEVQQLNVWGELISAVARFESSWNPCNRFKENFPKPDPITGELVVSEGLLQLSYQDVTSHPKLDGLFDWEKDKLLGREDCSKTILDPFRNLTGGVIILSDQVQKYSKIILKSPYWSTLRDPATGKDTRVAEIKAMIKKLPFVNGA